jgi:Cu(I)/Ag(I) efflux system membrane fusion protein
MRKLFNSKSLLIGLTLVLGLTIGWFLKPLNDQHITTSDNKHITKSEQQIWTCSMHPQIRRADPGDCPICGMELIPLTAANGASNPVAVTMSPTAIQLAQVQTTTVRKQVPGKSIRLTGKVKADERLLFTQSAHIAGRVEKLLVNFTGDFVSEGQVIAYVYSPELVTAREELLEAKKRKETQPALFNAAKEKLKSWKLTANQIAELLAENKTTEQFPVIANVSGYVTKKMVNPGDYIHQGDALYEIRNLSKLWILVDIYESDMNWIKKGDQVTYTLKAYPGKTFKGSISYIDPFIDPETRVAQARIEVNNQDLLLKPEMFVSATIEAAPDNNTTALTVPKTAVMWTGKRSVVYVMQKTVQGIDFSMREVRLGPDLGESYIIVSGLQPGEEIAINGTFSIDAAAQLAGKPSMMNPAGSVALTAHNHENEENGQMEDVTRFTLKSPVNDETKSALLPLFDNYFAMKGALVNDDYKKATRAGKEMGVALAKINANLFNGHADTLWMQQSASLKNNLANINQLENIKKVRQNFIGISNAMIAIAKTFAPFSGTIYVQQCPMANSNKGANWLSKEKEILNPYYGQSMLTCGENIGTLR